jgi:hypothetical protein
MEELIACQRILLCYQNITDAGQKQIAQETLDRAVKSIQPRFAEIPQDQFQDAGAREKWADWLRDVDNWLRANPVKSQNAISTQ